MNKDKSLTITSKTKIYRKENMVDKLKFLFPEKYQDLVLSECTATLKIADGNVTKAKLATAVQSSLDKVDTALQKANIVSGTANGTIAVDGTDVAVKGINSAAYKVAGAASGNVPVNGAALGTTANIPVVTNASGQLIPHASGALKSAAFADISDFDVAGTAQTLVTNLSNGQVTINKNDISTIKGQIADLESETVVVITEEEIEALFA